MNELLITQVTSPSNYSKVIRIPNKTRVMNEKKENFLNYLMQEKTRFADLEKIEDYYCGILVNTNKRFNTNKALLEQKRMEYESIIEEIQYEIGLQMSVQEGNLLQLYDNIIAKKKQIIRAKQHDLECYNKMYSRYYKAHYLIQKRFDDENKNEKENDTQYDKYVFINNHALLVITKQTEMLNELKSFVEISKIKYNDDISKRTAEFNELELEVMMIKNDTARIDNLIERIQQQRVEKKKNLSLIIQENTKIIKDISFAKLEHFKMEKQLYEIYSLLEVKDFFDAIDKFKLVSKDYYNSSKRYACLNKDIVSLNNKLTDMNNELITINKAIHLKDYDQEQGIDSCYSSEQEIEVQAKYFNLKKLEEAFKEKENFFKALVGLMLNYRKLIAESLKITYFPNYFTISNSLLKYHQYLNYKGDSLIIDFSLFLMNDEFNLFAFTLFNDFINSVFTLLSRGFNTVNIEMLLNSAFKKKKFEVIDLLSPPILNHFETQAFDAICNYAKIMSQRDNKDFINEKETKQKTVIDQLEEARAPLTKNDLYCDYIKYLNTNTQSLSNLQEIKVLKAKKVNQIRFPLRDQKADLLFMKLHPNRSSLLMDKYTNELVIKNNKQKETTSSINMVKSQIKLFTKKKSNLLNEVKDDDENSYVGIEEYKTKISNKKPFYYNNTKKNNTNRTDTSDTSKHKKSDSCKSLISTNESKTNKNTRLNDLRNLEFYYFIAKEKDKINNNDFNEIYYNFKRKYLTKTITSNRSSGNLFPTKSSINKNYNSQTNSLSLPHLNINKTKSAIEDNNIITTTILNYKSQTTNNLTNQNYA